ncbi:hypothetical protein [Acidianus manzaensis]|uniref:Thermopsin n=1 Tax=Acidianus manzaensis TaxID=282676 RepID=A0A1W6JZ29_9CREN|nr:hypothetical protein [Acidianus manzaensis]ARM75581.1 hypothetical protein B6F84_05710 [Acidianus manzaensis]
MGRHFTILVLVTIVITIALLSSVLNSQVNEHIHDKNSFHFVTHSISRNKANIAWHIRNSVESAYRDHDSILNKPSEKNYMYSKFLNVSFSYKVIGQNLPETPKIVLEFPNGTGIILTFSQNLTLKVPYNTEYYIQNIICLGNVRWDTNNITFGNITTSENIPIIYYEQDLVTFNYTAQGTGFSPPLVTYYYFGSLAFARTPATVWVDYNSSYSFPSIISTSNSEERWITSENTGIIKSPTKITVYYEKQYYISVSSSIPVFALVNSVNTTFSSGWYDEGTSIQIENITQYYNSTVRSVITSISPSSSFIVNSSETIKINSVIQYYISVVIFKSIFSNIDIEYNIYSTAINQPVSSIFPGLENTNYTVFALVNGVNTTFSSGWYDEGTSIQIENITQYYNSTVRSVITSISVIPSMHINYLMLSIPYNGSKFTVNGSVTVLIYTLTQYLITFHSPYGVSASIITPSGKTNEIFIPNGTSSIWVTPNSIIDINRISHIYINISTIPKFFGIIFLHNVTQIPSERIFVISVNPAFNISVTSPLNVSVNEVLQFYVNVTSKIPIKAIINGKETYLNSSWYNDSTRIFILTQYQISPTERYVIASYQLSYLVNKPLNIVIKIEKQYLVTINGVSKWYNAGSSIYLSAKLPFYESGEFEGTYKVPVNSFITVNRSITENLVTSLNFVILGGIIGILLITITLSLLLILSGKK